MKNTRVLTEGAIITALFAVILFLAIYVPIIGSFVIWFLPLPFIVYVLRHGLKSGLWMLVVAFLVSFIIGGIVALPLTILFGSGGIVVGELYRQNKAALVVLLGGSLSYIVNLLLGFIVSVVVFDIHPIRAGQEMMLQSIETAEKMLLTLGQESTEQLGPMYDMIEQLIYLAPVMIILTGIGFALLIQMIASVVVRKLGHKIERFPPFREWNFPKSFLWYYLIASIMVIVGLDEGSAFYIIAWNLFPILELIMTIQGLAFIFFYCNQKKISKGIPIAILIIGVLIPFVLYLVRILGIIDLGFDLRKRVEIEKK